MSRPKWIRWDFAMRYFQPWDKRRRFVICSNIHKALFSVSKGVTMFCADHQASTAPHWTSVQMTHLSLQKQHSLNICISQTGVVWRVSANVKPVLFSFPALCLRAFSWIRVGRMVFANAQLRAENGEWREPGFILIESHRSATPLCSI